MIVVDTQIIAAMTFQTEYSAVVNLVHQRNSAWEAPSLWKSEFLNVISLYYRKGLIDQEESVNALAFAERLIGVREHAVPANGILDCVMRSKCSSYDCQFVVLAESLRTHLITCDRQLLTEFPSVAISPTAYLAL